MKIENKTFEILKKYFDAPKKERTGKLKSSFDHVMNNKKGVFNHEFEKINFISKGKNNGT